MARHPNLLVIMCDQLRATALGLYGNSQVRTPHLERLAESGVLYRYAFTPYPVCVPARVALWTGRWPHLTGSRTNSIYLQPDEIHLLQLLRERGYGAALIGKNHCFTEEQIRQYFDTYYPVGHGGPADDGGDPEVAAARQWVRGLEGGSGGIVRRAGTGGPHGGACYAAGISPYPVEKHGTWLIGDRAERYLHEQARGQEREPGRGPAGAGAEGAGGQAQRAGRPWCAWVSIADPHTPYQVSEPYASQYPPESIQLPPAEPPGYPGKPDRVRTFAELMGADMVPEEHLRFVLSIYYGMIALIDDVVGRLLDALEETGQREHTLIVFTADHGDYMTEHRLVRKGASMYDSLVRIPLIVSLPGRIPAGQVSDDLVSLLDVFPTATHLLDLPDVPGRSGQPLPLTGVETDVAPRTAVFSEMGLEGNAGSRAEAIRRLDALAAMGRPHRAPWQIIANDKLKMVRTHEWKYVHQPGGEHELYHLTEDPYELVNLVDRPEHRERVCAFQRQLLDWAIRSEDTLPLPGAAADRGV